MQKPMISLVRMLFILFTINAIGAQTATSYSWSDEIVIGETYTWTVNDYQIDIVGNASELEPNPYIDQGSEIKVEPTVNPSEVSVNFISIDADQWQSYFNYSIDGVLINDQMDMFVYNLLIIPTTKNADGTISNVFENELLVDQIFIGNKSITNNVFSFATYTKINNEGLNFTESGLSQWDVSSGILQYYHSETIIESSAYSLNASITLSLSDTEQIPSLDQDLDDSGFLKITMIVGGIIAASFVIVKIIPLFSSAKSVKHMKPFKGPESLSMLTKEIISSIFGPSSSYFYLLAAGVDQDTTIDIDTEEVITPDLKKFKFLMHPVRFIMTRLLVEHPRLPTAKLREMLGISWSDLSTHTRAMKEKQLIHIESIVIGDKFTQVINLEPLGTKQFQQLSKILTELIDSV